MATLTDNPIITAASVEAIISKYNEPDWLAEERRAALRSFDKAAWPTNKTEEWRYTDLSRFRLDELALVDGVANEQVSERIRMRIEDSDAEGTIVLKGNQVIERDTPLQEAGVIFTDLRSAVAEHGDLIKPHLYSAINVTQSKFSALNAALWENGTFVYVPKDVEVALPLGTFYSADTGGLINTRTLVVLEPNAKVTFIDELTSEPFDAHMFNNAAIELILADGAKLRYVNLQNWSRNIVNVGRMRANIARNARLESLTVSLGSQAARAEVESTLQGPGAESEMLGLYFADQGQHFDQYTLQQHEADHAFSDLLFKGALRDRSKAVYSGFIVVEEGAQKTDAYQTNRNFLLDRESEAVSIPQLQIGANDVRCSHGSTVSPVPEDQRFYLMSRGLRPEVAEHVLVTGFLHEVTSRITLPKVSEYVERLVQTKLGVPGVEEKL